MRTSTILFIALLTIQLFPRESHAGDVCVETYAKAQQEKLAVPGFGPDRTVTGAGRLYFHMAPDARCRMKTVFVIPNDRLQVYADFGEYAEVIYWNPVTGAGTLGWVLTARLGDGAKAPEVPRSDPVATVAVRSPEPAAR